LQSNEVCWLETQNLSLLTIQCVQKIMVVCWGARSPNKQKASDRLLYLYIPSLIQFHKQPQLLSSKTVHWCICQDMSWKFLM
jgi:hypothetical protein